MLISREVLLSHVDYSAWASRQLLNACSDVSAEGLERDLRISHTSIAGTLRHIFYAERVWLKRLQTDSLPPMVEIGDQRLFRDPDPEPELNTLREKWPEVWKGMHEYVQSASEGELAGELRGVDCAIPRWKILLHSVNHSTLHRGQVTGMLRQLGKQPPGTDLFAYYLLGG